MITKIKKNFSILDLDKEEKFIEEKAEQGLIFQKMDHGIYYFGEGLPFRAMCIIEYFKEGQADSKFYEDQGLDLVYSYEGKIGFWAYFLGPYKEDLLRRPDDREDLYKSIKRRNDIFWTIIPLTLLLFSLYMVYVTKNYYFFILTLGSGLLLNEGRKINNKTKKKKE